MYLHIGAGELIRLSDIIGIFDLDGKVTTADTAAYLRRAEKEGRVTLLGDDLPKCFVLVRDQNEEKIFLSPISAKVLSERGDPFAPDKNTNRARGRS